MRDKRDMAIVDYKEKIDDYFFLKRGVFIVIFGVQVRDYFLFTIVSYCYLVAAHESFYSYCHP